MVYSGQKISQLLCICNFVAGKMLLKFIVIINSVTLSEILLGHKACDFRQLDGTALLREAEYDFLKITCTCCTKVQHVFMSTRVEHIDMCCSCQHVLNTYINTC